uniref:Uncharacterized protein n=1 Tax=Arundo donax TaxID=35708 RepID=A0A0A9D562_ARUDO
MFQMCKSLAKIRTQGIFSSFQFPNTTFEQHFVTSITIRIGVYVMPIWISVIPNSQSEFSTERVTDLWKQVKA